VYWGLIDDLADLEASDKEGCGCVQDPTTRKWSLGWAQDQRQRQRKRAKKKEDTAEARAEVDETGEAFVNPPPARPSQTPEGRRRATRATTAGHESSTTRP